MPNLSEKIKNAPEGSHLRDFLFDDSSSSEDEEWSEYDENKGNSEDEELSNVDIIDVDEVLTPRHTNLNRVTPPSARERNKEKGKSSNSPLPYSTFNSPDDTTPPTPTRKREITRKRSSNKKKSNKKDITRDSNLNNIEENSTMIDETSAIRVSLSPTRPKSNSRSSRVRDTVSSLEAISSPAPVDPLMLKKRKLESLESIEAPPKKIKSSSTRADKLYEVSINSNIDMTDHLEKIESNVEMQYKKKKVTKENNAKKEDKEIIVALKSNEIYKTNKKNMAPDKNIMIKKQSASKDLINLSSQKEILNCERGKGKIKKGKHAKKGKECMDPVLKESEKYELSEDNATTIEKMGRREKGTSSSTTKVTPQPKKKKKRTFQDQILAEMFFSCKAYSLKSLATTMKTTESALGHLMLSLLDKKIVMKKVFTSKSGKTREIYWANQDSKAKETTKLIPSMSDITAAQKELISLKALDNNLSKEISEITQELSNNEIDSQLLNLESEVKKLKSSLTDVHERIRKFQSQPLPHPKTQRMNQFRKAPEKTKAELARERCPRRLKMRINFQRSQWKERKEKCFDFIDQLSDAMEKQPKHIIKLLDLETDEMEGVKIPPRYVIEPRNV